MGIKTETETKTFLIREYVNETKIMTFKAKDQDEANALIDEVREGEKDYEDLPGFIHIRTKGNSEIDGPEVCES